MFFMWWNCLKNTLTLTLAQGNLLYMATIMLYLPPLIFRGKERIIVLWNILKHCRIVQSVLNGLLLMIYMWVDCTSCLSPGHFGGK